MIITVRGAAQEAGLSVRHYRRYLDALGIRPGTIGRRGREILSPAQILFPAQIESARQSIQQARQKRK